MAAKLAWEKGQVTWRQKCCEREGRFGDGWAKPLFLSLWKDSSFLTSRNFWSYPISRRSLDPSHFLLAPWKRTQNPPKRCCVSDQMVWELISGLTQCLWLICRQCKWEAISVIFGENIPNSRVGVKFTAVAGALFWWPLIAEVILDFYCHKDSIWYCLSGSEFPPSPELSPLPNYLGCQSPFQPPCSCHKFKPKTYTGKHWAQTAFIPSLQSKRDARWDLSHN